MKERFRSTVYSEVVAVLQYSSPFMKGLRIKGRVQCAFRDSFTLLEIMLSIAIIGVITAIVITAINPSKQLAKAQDIRRQSDSNQLQKALSQYLVDKGSVPDPVKAALGTSSSPVPICSQNATDKTVCVDASSLVGPYIASLPQDPAEACAGITGYRLYVDKMGPHIDNKHYDTTTATCPVSIDWTTDPNNGTVMSGTATLSGPVNLAGKTLRVFPGASLNLNGYNVTGNSITNNGTIIAQGTETVTASSNPGVWQINGSSNNLNVLANQTNVSSLTLTPSASATYTPISSVSVTGNLVVGSNATLDTTAVANSAFGSLLNNGTIILGNNAASITFGAYDSVNGSTSIAGTLIRSGLTYHDLTINSATAQLSGTTTINGSLTVNNGDSLAMNGNIAVVNGNVILLGGLSGQGTINLGNGGNSVTVANGSALSGADMTHKLTLSAAQTWYLQNAGALVNLALTNANAITTTTCSFCTNGGGNNANLQFLTYYTWTGTDGADPTNWTLTTNWQGGVVPPSGADVWIPNTGHDPVVPAGYVNTGNGIILGNVAIDAGATLTVNNRVNGGTYNGLVTIANNGNVFGGVFNGIVSAVNSAGIYAGIFNAAVSMNGGIINGGTFNAAVTFYRIYIYRGTYNAPITPSGVSFKMIYGGVFNSTVASDVQCDGPSGGGGCSGVGKINGNVTLKQFTTLDLSQGLTITGTLTHINVGAPQGTIIPATQCPAGKTLSTISDNFSVSYGMCR